MRGVEVKETDSINESSRYDMINISMVESSKDSVRNLSFSTLSEKNGSQSKKGKFSIASLANSLRKKKNPKVDLNISRNSS